jgi:cell division septation protein DedD
MSSFDRDATIERRQIHEISLNVARRLRHVLDRNRYIPAALRPEVESTVRVITGIQRDIDQIMGALPSDEALDFAILTHIMGGQRHALDLLEILEEKLEGGRSSYQRDSARVHQALIAVSREIEEDARRYAAESVAPPYEEASLGPARHAPPGPYGAGTPRRRSQAAMGRGAGTRSAGALRAFLTKPATVALAALALGAGLVVAIQKLMPPDGGAPPAQQTAAALAPEPTRGEDQPTGSTPAPSKAEPVTVTAPAVEQPYLVVLATRRSTEELQQDYRSFKGSYPDLLGSAKARVDRVQGQDKQTWYRLSLIPPQSRDDAKALCSNLRKAGLTGCWIKPVPLH